TDRLLAGPVGADAGFKVSPSPGLRILALTAVRPQGADFISAWALTPGGLFAVEAESEQKWSARVVALPDGEWFELWSAGGSAYVMARDGRVLSLPDRIALAGPLPLGATAEATRRLCRQPLAVGGAGLFRLRHAPDGGVASWEAQEL